MNSKKAIGQKFLILALSLIVAFAMMGIDAFATSKLTIKSTTQSINVGESVKVTSNKNVAWSISKGKSIVKITSKSKKSIVLKGIKSGTVVVNGKSGNESKKVRLNVYDELQVTPSSITIEAGKSVECWSNNNVKWSVKSGTDIITLSNESDNNVEVLGEKAGTAEVVATDIATGKSKSVSVSVTDSTTSASTNTENKYVPEKASTSEVKKMMSDSDSNTELVDARPQEAYAGWKLQGAKHGGHLKSAILYSARWLDMEMSSSKREKKLTAYNKAIGLNSRKSYIIYDYGGARNAAASVAEYFHSQGITNVKVYDAKNLIDRGENLVSYKNYQRYIPAEVVKDISDYKTGKDKKLSSLTKEVISSKDIKKVVLVDVSYGNVHESSYLSDGHVPGAVHINTNVYERPRSYVPEKREKYSVEYRLISLQEFRDSVCPQYGINKNSIVIATSNDGRPIARFGFMLRSLGVKYYGMSGLMNSWKYNNYELDTKNVVKPKSIKSFGSSKISNPNEIVWMKQIKQILTKNKWDENNHTAGTVVGGDKIDSTYSYHDLYGKIPGTLSASGGVFENPDGTPAI